jgi:hypothetical protein
MSERRLKPYPAYKDSGVEWLGEIPAHWEVNRLSELTTLLNGYPFDSEQFTQGEGVPLVRIRDLTSAETEINFAGPVVDGAWIDDRGVTHAVLKTIAAFLNTEGGDLLIGVADDRSIVGIELDQLEDDDKFMRHLAQAVRNGLGDRAGTCIDPRTQIVSGRTVCVISCQRSPEPVFLRWHGLEASPQGDFYVRSGPGTVKSSPESAKEYIRTRFGARTPEPT